MTWVWLLMAISLWAPSAVAQCRPSQRSAFAAGLEALARGDLRSAAAAFNGIVQAQPDCAEARNNLAVVLTEQGRIDEAAYQLRQALRARPDYYRARLNLERLEGLLAAQAREAAGVAEGALETRPLASAPPAPPAPPNIAALEPPGTSVCVLEPARARLCLYRRAPHDIVADGCYATAGVEMRVRRRWLVTSDLRPDRIRLVDELGHEGLKIVPDSAAVTGDVVQLQRRDFENLATKVVPWRTACIVLEHAATDAAPGVPGSDGTLTAALREAIERWRQAQEEKQPEAYFNQYSGSFVPQLEPEVAGWRERKRYAFEHAGTISLEVAAPSLFLFDDATTAISSFEQWYRSGTKVAHTFTVIRWQREADRWLINAETALKEYP